MQYSIPTIVVTGADTKLQEMAGDEGAFADLPKTFGGEALLKVIELGLRSERRSSKPCPTAGHVREVRGVRREVQRSSRQCRDAHSVHGLPKFAPTAGGR
jgi:hypothetical protein